MKSSFFGIIPTVVRHNKELKANAKLIFSEIMACLDESGVCTKPNIYFSNVFDVSKTTVSTCISSLRELGFLSITMEYEINTNKLIKRYITPINLLNGVSFENENTPVNNFNGVSNDDPQNNDANKSSQLNALLYNNNNINKIYSDKKSKVILNRQINDKQKSALQIVVRNFYETQSKRYPDVISRSWYNNDDLVNGSLNTLYDLIDIDKFDYEVVRDVIKWAVDDNFWSQNLLSLRALRTKSSNGLTKFANVKLKYTQYK